MKRTVLYLDTEEVRISRILNVVADTLEYSDVIQVRSVNEAYRVLLERTIDIFIINITLDISRVSDVEGLRLTSCIREIPRYVLTPVILISSLQDPQLYAFEELNCLGYLSKNFASEKLVELLQKASHFRTKRPTHRVIIFRKNRALYPVRVKDIVYIVRENGLARVHMSDGTVLEMPYVSYSKLLHEAAETGLFMCNRSTIVNRDYVYAVDPTNCFVILRDKWGMLDMGLKYRAGVKAALIGSYQACGKQKNKKKRDK